MAKRKREVAAVAAQKSRKQQKESSPKQAVKPQPKSKQAVVAAAAAPSKQKEAANTTIVPTNNAPSSKLSQDVATSTSIQVVTGSYERVLHGFAATFPQDLITGPPADSEQKPAADFTDTFLFNAHASAIRCLALAPLSDETSKVTLATGSKDERINLYSLSTAPPAPSKLKPKLPSLHGGSITENPKNKELGSLLHHSSNITALYFPTRSKLLSAAEDSTIAITRTRDWTALSTIKAPIPKPQGRPSGDTAGPGEVPSGINDFAVHPSMKLMVSVGKGEKCMRLWNLVTGKKAGVLNFGRELLTAVGEGRFGAGEGRRVIWDKEGEEYAVAFERGVLVFSIDSQPKGKIVPSPRTKIHQMHYLPSEAHASILLVSTEDGRVLLYDTASTIPTPAPENGADAKENDDIPSLRLVAQIGGPAAGMTDRVKDFEILPVTPTSYIVVTGSSNGSVRFWSLSDSEIAGGADAGKAKGFTALQVGTPIGSYSTGTRITCLKAFVMTGTPEEDEEEVEVIEKDSESESDDEDEE